MQKYGDKDVAATMKAMTDIGIKGETIGKYLATLEWFTDSQGHKKFSDGMVALTNGRVKAGRGIENMRISVIQQMVQQCQSPQAWAILAPNIFKTVEDSAIKNRAAPD